MTTSSIIKSLGASEIDTAELVANLVKATKEPRQKLIDADKKKAEVAISSTALLKSALSTLQSVATELGSVNKLNKLNLTSTDASVVTAIKSSTGVAAAGAYGIEVSQLATRQRTLSAELPIDYITPNEIRLSFSRLGSPTPAEVVIPKDSTPAQIATALNSSEAAQQLGLRASVINTGKEAPWRIVLESESGAGQDFTVAAGAGSTAGTLGFDVVANTVASAANAKFKVNGVDVERSSNTVSDVISGLTLQLSGAAVGREVRLGVSVNSADIVAGAKNLVETYNLLSEFLTRATGPKIEGDEIAGSLRADSNARSIKNTLRTTLTRESTSASGAITHWSSLGVSLDRNGVLNLDESKFIKAFEENPQDAIKALSNNAASPYIFARLDSGLAGDLAVMAYGMVRSTGVVPVMTKGFEDQLGRVEKKQTDLDKTVARLTAQYERQFASLNSILASFKDTQNQLSRSLNLKDND